MQGRKQPVRAINEKGVATNTYKSLVACAKALGLQPSHICEVLQGKRKHHKGYRFDKMCISHVDVWKSKGE